PLRLRTGCPEGRTTIEQGDPAETRHRPGDGTGEAAGPGAPLGSTGPCHGRYRSGAGLQLSAAARTAAGRGGRQLPLLHRGRPGDAHRLGRGDLALVQAAERELPEEPLALGVDLDGLTRLELAVEDLLRQDVLDLPLDGAAQRPGTEDGVVATLGEQLLGRVGEPDRHALGA